MGNILEEAIVMTERETLDLTVHHRIDGAKSQKKAYIKYGQLKSPNTIESHRKNLELLFEKVVVGKKTRGKDREYYLYNKRNRTLKKPQKIIKVVNDPDDLAISNYVFNKLLIVADDIKHGATMYWANGIGMPLIYSQLELETLFEGKYSYNTSAQIPAKITQEFHSDLARRSKSYLETAFRQLAKEDKIKLSTTYYEVSLVTHKTEVLNEEGLSEEEEKTEQVYTKITKKKFNEIQKWISTQCELYSLTKEEYTQMGIYKRKKFEEGKREAKNKIDEGLKIAFKILMVFTGFGIKLIKTEIESVTTYTDFIQAYFNKFIKHSIQKQDSSNYINSPFPSKAFYVYNTLIILKRIGVKNIDEIIKEYKPTHEAIQNTINMRQAYAQKKEREEDLARPKAF